MQLVDALVCYRAGPTADRAATRATRLTGTRAGAPAPGRHLRHRLSHLRRQASVPAVSARHGPRTRRGGRRSAAGVGLRARRDLRRQSLSLLRPLHRLPRRQAKLLREHFRAGRPPGRRHARAAVRAGRQSRSRRPDRRRMRDRGVPCDRRACGAARRGDAAGQGAGRRRRTRSAWASRCLPGCRAPPLPCSTATPERAESRRIHRRRRCAFPRGDVSAQCATAFTR